jgi:PTH2 family peptidyl-tRNA hydrolase
MDDPLTKSCPDKTSFDDELIQYYVVNKELNMSIGKTAAQVAHASMLIALRDQNDEKFRQWMSICMKKIILGGAEKDLLKLKDQGFLPIIDKGYTEVPENSLTVIGLPVMTRKEAKKFIGKLRLLEDMRGFWSNT